MNYANIATAVFTPLEYGCVGLSEEDAIAKLGMARVKVFHTIFKPLEWNFLESHKGDSCFGKAIVDTDNNKVIGLHYLGPNAGDVI